MKNLLLFFVKSYLFWIALSIVSRAIFLLYQWHDTLTLTSSDIFNVFWNGLQHDLSLGGYVMLFASLFLMLAPIIPSKIMRTILKTYTGILLFFYILITVINLELFTHWGYHIDTTPLRYLNTPMVLIGSTDAWHLIGGLGLMLVLFAASYYLFLRFAIVSLNYEDRPWRAIPRFLFLGASMILPIRGGLNVAPMNPSFVYFHPKNMYANQAAVNPIWNFISELVYINQGNRKLQFMKNDEANAIVEDINNTGNTELFILNTEKPNVVFLLMESFSANAIEVLGGKKGVTPNVNTLAKEGILFDHIYASSFRSDRGLVASLSGIPSNPFFAIINKPTELMKYPSLPQKLEEKGYTTQFYYAGDLNFGNFNSYIRMNFQTAVTENDFSGEAVANRNKWGMHDEYMYQRMYDDISKAQQPFMYAAFNMSSHEPFDVPFDSEFQDGSVEGSFLNAIHYTDFHLGKFIDNCKQSGIWDNSIFILMADHSTRIIGNHPPHLPESFHIPLIISGGALAIRDTVVSTIGSQTDMVATVLTQLGINTEDFTYSRNLLGEKVQDFAFFSNSNTAGVISHHGTSIANVQDQKYIVGDSIKENIEYYEAYIQQITNEFVR